MKRSSIEESVMSVPSADLARKWLRHYASTEHMAGTRGDLEMAEFTRDKMQEFGLERAKIVPMDALLSYPIERHIEVVSTDDASQRWSPALEEAILEEDPTSGSRFRNLTFLAYAATGQARGEMVYANYGRPEDFEELEKRGIHVAGKIVLVRYGQCFRGLKIMNAQAFNASAVLIFSDPEDDGFGKGKVYPDGPWRPASSVQRGSAQFNSLCAGDPARAASGFDSKSRCGLERDELIPSIPAIPISYEDVTPLLERLGGPEAPHGFQGGLNLTYRLGPSSGWEATVEVNNTREVKPIWNVIAEIPGSLEADEDQPIVIGNHRDAWVFGAADPNSGSAVLLEVARALGKLVRDGWQPKRTIVLASWSGEEFGLLGSTGWGEANAGGLLKRAALYINTDVGVSGDTFYASASPSVGRAILHAAAVVVNPATGRPLLNDWDASLGTLGSGSDYTVFLDHLGIASMDLRFGASNSFTYGVYHSTYDSYTWIEKEADPTFAHHVALTRLIGVLAVRFSSSAVLPISLADHGAALSRYVDHLGELPKAGSLDLSVLRDAVRAYRESAVTAPLDNDLLGAHERLFLAPEGLPQRPWFKHVLQAPGLYLGYDAKVFPGIDQAVSDGDGALAQSLVARYADLLRSAAARVGRPQASSSLPPQART
ncbi:Transferrin receptor protein 2 [Hondaea fermentalgiana]|uniref:Transferrin receptor protein 2 n=1 Tax=Hondaea fermentalgiana TaxID=2315210 RepID=A0A2R5G5K5_9STRA|nr:Transferrin receptor protein 2 [Hondaea fermentalgiana]|eukprot:GBG25629.1 Transferrin receptor protein 2 [Hondaea fermentalgiana]